MAVEGKSAQNRPIHCMTICWKSQGFSIHAEKLQVVHLLFSIFYALSTKQKMKLKINL
jgi:hypothetical protein